MLVRSARQDFGNFQDLQVMQRCYEERRRFGRIWYRFPSGEAGSDVYSRVGDLTLTLTLALTLTRTLNPNPNPNPNPKP